MAHFLLVCRDSSRPVGVAITEAPSMLEAYTNAQNLADVPFGETHELSAKMMTTIPPAQIGRMMSGAEAAQMIGRLVERKRRLRLRSEIRQQRMKRDNNDNDDGAKIAERDVVATRDHGEPLPAVRKDCGTVVEPTWNPPSRSVP